MPSEGFEELLQSLSGRQLPLPRLRKNLQAISRAIKKDHSLSAEVQRHDTIECILYYVEKPRVSDLALSVLANCLTTDKIRSQVLNGNGVNILERLLTNIADECIRIRACRALCNLGLSPRGAYAIHQVPTAIHGVIDLLNTAKSSESQGIAMRTLMVLSGMTAYREKITNLGGPGALGRCLGTVEEPLRKSCVNALQQVTYKCNPACAKQVKDSGAFPLLVELSDTLKGALFTMVNLAGVDEMLIDVGSSGIVPKIVTYLEECKLPQKKWEEAFRIMCRLCKEPYNLIRVRDAGGLPFLVNIILGDNKRLRVYATYTLLQYKFDDTALAELIKLNLIETLVKHLDHYVTENAQEHQLDEETDTSTKNTSHLEGQSDRSSCVSAQSAEQDAVLSHTDTDTVASVGSDHDNNAVDEPTAKRPKLFCLNSPSYLEIMQAKSLAFNYDFANDEYSDYMGLPGYSGEMSPRSARSPVMPDFDNRSSTESPSHSGSEGTSPSRTDDETDKIAYSPVHDSTNGSTSTDDETDEKSSSFINFLTHKRYCSLESEPENQISVKKNDVKSDEVVSVKEVIVDHVLRLFEIYTFPRSISLLGEKSALICKALTRYIAAIPTSFSRAEQVVLILSQHPLFFQYFLIDNRIIELINSLKRIHNNENCSRCFYLSTVSDQLVQRFSLVAEGGGGSGELARLLVGENNFQQKQYVALTIGFIVRKPNVLYDLLFHCRAIDIIFDNIETCAQASENKSLDQLTLVFRSLREIGKTCKFRVDEFSTDKICDYDEQKVDNDLETVTIELDEGETLVAEKAELISKSTYFEAMFRSDSFIESRRQSARLPSVKISTLKVVLHCATCIHRCTGKIRHLEAAVECLQLTNMLMMNSVEKRMLNLVTSLLNSSTDIVKVYPKIALLSCAGALKERCVMLLFGTDDACLSSSVETLHQILKTALAGQFLEDVRSTIKTSLANMYQRI